MKIKPTIIVSHLFLLCLLFSCESGPEVGLEEKGPSPSVPEGSDYPEGSDDLLSLLPQDGDVENWAPDGEPRFFDAGNLWEFINGAAEGYLAYGFEEVVTADYIQQGGDQSVIDIYRMKDPLNAFGLYSQERNADYDFMDIGGEGYVGGTALNFWHGPYYIKILVFDDKEELKAQMVEMGNHIAGNIDDSATEPAEVAYFPTENQLPYAVQYLPKDVLGQSYLVNAFESRYQAGDQEYKIILASLEDSEAATEALARYRTFQSGGEDLEGLGDGGFVGQDSFYGKVLAVRSGNRLVIALGVPSESAGKDLIAQTLAKIDSGP